MWDKSMYAPEVLQLIGQAEIGDGPSQMALAKRYLVGDGVPKKYTRAMRWFEAAARQGDAKAAYWLGCLYQAHWYCSHLEKREGKHWTSPDEIALEWFCRAAEGGIEAAWYWGARLDAPWANCPKAARMGFRKITERLALCTLNSGSWWTREEDLQRGFRWRFLALAQRVVGSPTEVRGCDPVVLRMETGRAYPYYRERPDTWPVMEDADGNFRIVSTEGVDPRDATSEAEARDFQRLLAQAEAGDAVAQVNVARRLMIGYGAPSSEPEAYLWMRKAAKQGLDVALYALGLMTLSGIGTEASSEEGARLLFSASATLPAAQVAVGELYRRGIGVEKTSSEEAVKWFRRAVEAEFGEGEYALARCYDRGYGVTKSRKNLMHFYERAEAHGIPEASHRLSAMRSFFAPVQGEAPPGAMPKEEFPEPAAWELARAKLASQQYYR